MSNYPDNVYQGPPPRWWASDPQLIDHCAWCERKLYENDLVYDLGDNTFLCSLDCVLAYAKLLKTRLEVQNDD